MELDMLEILLLVCGIVGIVFIVDAIVSHQRKLEQLQRYWEIEIGMPEDEMLDIMGEGYSRSLLKNNRVKYEWRINATSYGSSYNGSSTRTYSGVKKVTIYTVNGFVESILSHNV